MKMYVLQTMRPESNFRCKFHVNIITGSGDMTIFFYERLTRNPEIGNKSAFWSISGDWG